MIKEIAALFDNALTVFIAVGAAISVIAFFVLLFCGKITMKKMRDWWLPW